MKHTRLFLGLCAILAAAPARAQVQSVDSVDSIVDGFKARFDALKAIPQAPALAAAQSEPQAAAPQQAAPPKLVLNCSYRKGGWDSWESGEFANYDKKNYESLFQLTTDQAGWTASSAESVDGKPLTISVTTSDGGLHAKARAAWGSGAAAISFAPKAKKLDGDQFTLVFKTPECVVVGCGVNAEPPSLKGRSCE
jgi:hypothetical protein